MNMIVSFIAVLVLVLFSYAASAVNLHLLLGVLIPYAAGITFIAGFIYRVLKWGRSPVPFRIPTTCGQQKTLSWIRDARIENPSSRWGVVARMALEIFFFRSLFRNLRTELRSGPKLSYAESKWLWFAGLAFHYSFLIILVRHFRFFIEKVPAAIQTMEGLDSFFQVGAPLFYTTDLIILASVTFLFLRRVLIPQVKYISLPADYFPLFLILGIAFTGVLMRYLFKVDVVSVKVLAMGLVAFNPTVPEGISSLFYIHLFLVCVLFAYFPFSKLMHMGGIFLSPTRNMINNNRVKRHVNPWDYPVKVHTYEEYEDDFREKMKDAGIPVEKE